MPAGALLLALIVACEQPAEHVTADVIHDYIDAPGAITGRICSADLDGWLADVEVYTHIVRDGEVVETRVAWTDPAGRFLLDDLPAGLVYDLFMQLGNARLTDDEVFGIFLDPGETVEVGDSACSDLRDMGIVIVTGTFDDAEVALRDLGLDNFARVDGVVPDGLSDFLLDPAAMAATDLIVVESGIYEPGVIWARTGGGPDEEAEVEARLDSLRDFVSTGGNLLVTDQSYDLVERAWPEYLDFYGDDLQADAAQRGPAGEISAAVSDGAMADWLDLDAWSIDFPSPGWAVIESTSSSVRVHSSGNVHQSGGPSVPNAPLLVSFQAGEGTVIFASFSLVANRSPEQEGILSYLAWALLND